jgi:ATP-dependent Clp protease protease subunit
VQVRKKRSALPHSRVIHQPSGGAQGVATDMEINERNVETERQLYKSFPQHSGQTFDKVYDEARLLDDC